VAFDPNPVIASSAQACQPSGLLLRLHALAVRAHSAAEAHRGYGGEQHRSRRTWKINGLRIHPCNRRRYTAVQGISRIYERPPQTTARGAHSFGSRHARGRHADDIMSPVARPAIGSGCDLVAVEQSLHRAAEIIFSEAFTVGSLREEPRRIITGVPAIRHVAPVRFYLVE
jgi:hypothetical protein